MCVRASWLLPFHIGAVFCVDSVNVGLQSDVYPSGFCTQVLHVPYCFCSMFCVGPLDWYTQLRKVMKDGHLTL
jgi:hypothetical protein